MEEHLIGGECSYYACMPSKALLRPAELLAEVRRVPGRRGGRRLDAEAVLARRDEVIHDRDDSSQLPWLEERGVALVRGRGRLDGERRVAVGDDGSWPGRRSCSRPGSGAADAADRGPARGAAVDEPRGDDREVRAREPGHPRRRRGRRRAGAGWASLGSRVALVEAADRG